VIGKLLKRWRMRRRIFGIDEPMDNSGLDQTDWEKRIEITCSSPDNLKIPRVENAGTYQGRSIVMHNGVLIAPFSYYGEGIFNLLVRNRGVHEPQEEHVFQEVIKALPESPVMLELGSYWGFYSLWMLEERPRARCFLVEPEDFNLEAGKVNFRLNRRKGKFIRGFAGSLPEGCDESIPLIQVDDFLEKKGIRHLDMLHADIQGAEAEMLRRAEVSLSRKAIGFVFISTHWPEVHDECLKMLRGHNYSIVSQSTVEQSFSHDGLIVARSPLIKGPDYYPISLRV